jgi:nicotinate dehydrogenase subunit B
MSTTTPQIGKEKAQERMEQRIAIEADGTVVVRSGKIEYGQGIRTGFVRIVVEELAVDPAKVRVELGETDRVPWDLGTFGSMSTAVDGKIVRAAAACARKMLLERAALRLATSASELSIAEGRVAAADGRSIPYQELVADEPLTGMVPEDEIPSHPVSPPQDVPSRLEALAVVTGRACYPGDVRLPGMVWGQVLHPPVHGSEIASVDESKARALPGVLAIVQDQGFLGVVAQRSQQAAAAIRALQVEWKSPSAAPDPPVEAVLRHSARADAVFASASRHLSAEYHAPHISHVPIGPSAAVADVREKEVDLYVTTQRPFGLRDQVAQLLSLAPDRVHVHPQMMSGIYGRGNMNDAAMDAVRLSRAAKRPVLVQWSREEEFRSSPHRPVLDAKVSAALSAEGTVLAWRYLTETNPHTYAKAASLPLAMLEMTSGRNAVPHYRLGCTDVILRVSPAPIRTGPYRSLAAAPNIFAIESFMDELAHLSGQDPISFRLRHIEDERLLRVLSTVHERSHWDQRPRRSGHGFGVACTIYHGTYIAEAVEIELEPDGRVRIENVWCAVDAGRLVHPDGARNQIEGGIQQAASWTLLEELGINGGRVMNASFKDYPISSFRDAIRRMDITFLSEPGRPSTGIGEAGTVPMAAALANAVFEACGARIRRLPLTRARISSAIASNGH